MVVDRVEPAEHEPVERPRRKGERHGDAAVARRPRELRQRPGVVSAKVVAATEPRARRERIDPRDRVLEVRFRFAVDLEELVESAEADRLLLDERVRDRPERELRPGHKARQPEAADGRAVPVGVFRRRADEAGPVGAEELEPSHVAAQGAGAVVVLAVHVIGDGAAERHVLRAGGDRQEPSLRHDESEDLGQAHARLAAHDPEVAIECQEAVEPPCDEQRAAVVQARVAVAPSEPVRKRRQPRRNRERLRSPRHTHDLLPGACCATPR